MDHTDRAGADARSRSGLDEAAADRVSGETHAVAQVKRLEDVRPVTLDGRVADHEHLGDLPAGTSLGDQLYNLQLPLR